MTKLSIKAVTFLFVTIAPSLSAIAAEPTPPAAPLSAAENVDATRKIMSEIFSSLTRVLPISFNQDEYSKAANRDKILADLKIMSDSSGALAAHVKKFEGSFGFIAKSMARDMRDIHGWYQRGSYNESRYLLHQLSENCVSCHMKLPDPGHAPKMDHFFKDMNVAKLPAPERAKLQVAMRQFDDALKTWEEMFATWAKPGELFVMDSLTEYLKVAIRVKNDAPRALNTLNTLTKRTGLPKFMQREVATWKKSLAKLAPEVTRKGNELTRAAKIIQSARQNMDYPMDRTGLVDFIVASGMLNRFLNEGKPTSEQQSHAYYLLGLTETLIGRNAWLTQTDYYLEASVRAAPKSKYAALAYDALEQQVLMEYSGSGGINIPKDIKQNIDELRAMTQK